MLEFKNFNLSYEGYESGEKVILKDINTSFKAGSVNLITGQSGSGKSSLIKVINGIIPEITKGRISGTIEFHGEDLIKRDITERSKAVSTVFQNPKNQFYAVNSLDEMAFALENRNTEKEEIFRRIEKYSELLDTEKLLNRDLFKLSGGEKQLVAITSVAIMDNEIYIFDEPSASLDKRSIEKLARAIRVLKDMGKLIIIAEHRLYYLKDLLDRLFVLENNKIFSYDRDQIDSEIIKKHRLRSPEDIEEEDMKAKSYIEKSLFDKTCRETDELVCKNFHCKYKNEKEVFDFSISFDRGIHFIVGDNGIGKSSFIRNLCGLNKNQRGESYYLGEKIKNHGEYISLVMQDVNYQLFTESVYSEISIVTEDEERKEKTLRELDLWDKRNSHPQSLSGGEKQRLALALAKASPKKIVVLDEPTSGLCYRNMEKTVKLIKEMKEEGKIIIIITHDYEFIKMAGEKVVKFINE